ncbi:DUF1206 domain-containing protein [Brevundimonas vitis]|uniref:DUF1206 domain-containing protein n=1 Tax=Brevundimonas vitisensis TaxID=2800818 RepID=A0ABX7BKI3_9CAUL|nr:DUF1206 domain-containing protein [Brevundimonas vitisensis]QQQ18079.1 DUF1206 domain-containing protein [Brevundimonas vitisensis]
MASLIKTIRTRLADLGDEGRRRLPILKRVPPLHDLLEGAARVGYGARGFVYLSIGLIVFLAATDQIGQSTGSSGAVAMLAEQPFGRVWLILLGLGLWAFVVWRVLQAVFDADREGRDSKALMLRAGQAMSGVFYGLLAAGVFEILDEFGRTPSRDDETENQQKAAMLLDLPFGDLMLIGAGLIILAVGVGNMIKGATADFAEDLACSTEICERVTPVARAGYVARGLAYLPLAGFVILAGVHARASDVTSFGGGLDAMEALPAGSWLLGVTAIGLMAFGAFAFVEARYRRIRPPKKLIAG